jgi:hypothetical protein
VYAASKCYILEIAGTLMSDKYDRWKRLVLESFARLEHRKNNIIL